MGKEKGDFYCRLYNKNHFGFHYMDWNTDILIWTSLGFLIPMFLYPKIPRYFKLLLSYTTFASFSFWISDTPYGFFHQIYSIMARIAIISVILYKVLFYRKHLFWFLWLTSITLFWFYMSSVSSNEEWGSETHVGYHVLAHLYAVLAMLVGFIGIPLKSYTHHKLLNKHSQI